MESQIITQNNTTTTDNTTTTTSDTIIENNIKMESDESFECLVIKPGLLNNLSWKDPNYISQVIESEYIESFIFNQDNFADMLGKCLNVNKYKSSNILAQTEIIGDEPYYLYEMSYINFERNQEYIINENINEIGNLLSINGDLIFSNIILFKNHIPSLSKSMKLCSMTKEDLKRLLYKRANNTIVLGDSFNEVLMEENIMMDIEQFSNKYFEGEEYKKKEIAFLMHNINIWYSVGLIENNFCGNLIDEKYIDKFIIFTMNTDTYRGNITLDEVKKIINLSLKLSEFKTPSEFYEEEIDNLGRKVIYNKYRVLDKIYNDNN